MNVNDIKYKPLLYIILHVLFDKKYEQGTYSLEHYTVDKEAYRPIWSIAKKDFEPDRFYIFLITDDMDKSISISFSEGRSLTNTADVSINLTTGELEKI